MHNRSMIYGYARVSSNGQDLAQQLAQLDAAGCTKIYREKVSAATAERPQLKRAIGALDAGDVLMVTATDRLARNTRDLLNILHAVKEAGAGFRSIAEPMVDTTSQFAEVVRSETNGQDMAQQRAQLDAAGCTKIYREKVSAATAGRPQLKRAIGALDAGDVLMVTATDRLARNTRDLLNILHAVKEAGAGFRSIAEPMVDTTSQFAEVVIAVLGIAASYERQRITERTAAGRVQAKARGVKFGRRAALTPHQQAEALQRLAAGDTQRTVAALFDVDQATISRLVGRAACRAREGQYV